MSKKKIRVLIVSHAHRLGGATISLVKIIDSIDKNKFDVDVLFFKKPEFTDYLIKHGVNYYVSNSIFYNNIYQNYTYSEASFIKWYQFLKFSKQTLIWFLSRYYFSKKEISKYNYDIIHLNSSVLTDWLAASKKVSKVVIHIREPFRAGKFKILHSILTRQMEKYADRIIAISKDNAKRIRLPHKTTIVYNYSDIPDKAPIEESYASKKVLYVGGTRYIKGFFTLAKAIPFINQDVKIVVLGVINKLNRNHRLKGKIKKILRINYEKNLLIKYIHNKPNIEVIGLVDDVENYFKDVCCLITPFAVPHFSRPAIESFLHCKPVIATNVEGMDEIIQHKINGLLVPNEQPELLADAINNLTSNPIKAKEYGYNGYEMAKAEFSSKNIQLIEKLYINILNA